MRDRNWLEKVVEAIKRIISPVSQNGYLSEEKRAKLQVFYNDRLREIENDLELELARELYKYFADEVLETTHLIQWYLVLYGGTWLLFVQSFRLLSDFLPLSVLIAHSIFLFFASVLGVVLRHRAWQYKLNTDVQKQLAIKAGSVSAEMNRRLWELNQSVDGKGIEIKQIDPEKILEKAILRIMPERHLEKIKAKHEKNGAVDHREVRFRQMNKIKQLINISIASYFASIAIIAIAIVLKMLQVF